MRPRITRKKKKTPDGNPELSSKPLVQMTSQSTIFYQKTPTTVYLAGKMTGLSPSETRAWRMIATAKLEAAGFVVIDPTLTDIPETKPKLIVESNKTMIKKADVILMELVYPKKHVSIGTLGELFFSATIGKPVICFTTFNEGDQDVSSSYTDHPWIADCVTGFGSTLNKAIELVINSF